MKKTFTFLLLSLILASCSTFKISKESLVQQLKENQNISKTSNVASLGTGYYSNNLQKIRCKDKNGHDIDLYTGKNMNFVITRKSDGKKINLYFDTVYFKNDSLSGLRSRILGGKRSIAVNEISEITIKSETKRFDNVKVSLGK